MVQNNSLQTQCDLTLGWRVHDTWPSVILTPNTFSLSCLSSISHWHCHTPKGWFHPDLNPGTLTHQSLTPCLTLCNMCIILCSYFAAIRWARQCKHRTGWRLWPRISTRSSHNWYCHRYRFIWSGPQGWSYRYCKGWNQNYSGFENVKRYGLQLHSATKIF